MGPKTLFYIFKENLPNACWVLVECVYMTQSDVDKICSSLKYQAVIFKATFCSVGILLGILGEFEGILCLLFWCTDYPCFVLILALSSSNMATRKRWVGIQQALRSLNRVMTSSDAVFEPTLSYTWDEPHTVWTCPQYVSTAWCKKDTDFTK